MSLAPRSAKAAAIRDFEAAARHENFTAAAAELGMTQAAVSYQIRLLVERIGAPLFRRVVLTEAGRRAAAPIAQPFGVKLRCANVKT